MTKEAQSQKAREASRAVQEYVGHLKFGPVEGAPVTPQTSLEDWVENARAEWVLTRLAAWILNATDEEMEEWIGRADDPDKFVDWLIGICEECNDWAGKYEVGTKVLRTVSARIIVMGERYAGPEKMAHVIPKRH